MDHSIGGWIEKTRANSKNRGIYIRIESVYLQTKQSTPDGSFNWRVDGENKSKE